MVSIYSPSPDPSNAQTERTSYGAFDHVPVTPQYDMAADELDFGGQERTMEAPATITTVVPEGAVPGTKIYCCAPDGQQLRLTVPSSVPPGSMMTLTQDMTTRQWKCVADVEEPADAAPSLEDRHEEATMKSSPTKVITGSTSVTTVGLYGGETVPRVYSRPSEQTLSVNLSYVPEPVQGHMFAQNKNYYAPSRQEPSYEQRPPYMSMPGQHSGFVEGRPSFIPAMQTAYSECRPSYTPTPHSAAVEGRPSHTPTPQVLPGAMMPQHSALTGAGILDASTTNLTPQRIAQQPMVGQPGPYAPPPSLAQRTDSYVPLPIPTVQGAESIAAPVVDFVDIDGNKVPILADGHLRMLPPVKLREHAVLLHRVLGPGRLGPMFPMNDEELVPWILDVQYIHLVPLRRPPITAMSQSITPQQQMMPGPLQPPMMPQGGSSAFVQPGQPPPMGWVPGKGAGPRSLEGYDRGTPVGFGYGPSPPFIDPPMGMARPPHQAPTGGCGYPPPQLERPGLQMPHMPPMPDLPPVSVPGLPMPGQRGW